jgi:23S rRNA (guanine2445-N2)-methyltransferase / 23S rRNA (guanine2069-N7)-methyltransferase
VALARKNAERAGLAAEVTIAEVAFAAAVPPAPAGLVIMNPPYGRRLGTAAVAARLPREIGRVLRARWGGWRAAVLAPDRQWARSLGMPAQSHALVNGGLRVHLLVIDVAGGPL